MAPAIPFSTTALTIISTRTSKSSGVTMSHRPRSAASPITITLLTVPRPGFCRSGIQSSKTTAPTTIVTVPKLSGR